MILLNNTETTRLLNAHELDEYKMSLARMYSLLLTVLKLSSRNVYYTAAKEVILSLTIYSSANFGGYFDENCEVV